jgi:Tol biopolymer transport system component
VVASDSTRGARRVQFPNWLPDGERFTFLSRGETDEGALLLVSASGATDTIIGAASWVHYSEPGVLAFVRDGNLLAQRFDVRSGRVSGNPYSVADGVRYFLSTGVAAFATSAGATLAYQTGTNLQHLVWFDRTGQRGNSVGPAANYFNLTISPDGKHVLFDRADPKIGTYDVGLFDLERGVASPITTSRATEVFSTWVPHSDAVVQTSGDDVGGRFSPDGRWVAFLSNESGSAELYITPFPGPGARLRVSPGGATDVRWSHATGEFLWLAPDGRLMAARVRTDPLRIGAPTTLFTLPPGMTWTTLDISPDGQRLLAAISVEVANHGPVTVITSWTAGLPAPVR